MIALFILSFSYHYHGSVVAAEVVLQFVDLELEVGLMQRPVHEEVVSAVVEQLRYGMCGSDGPEGQPGGNEQEGCADEREEEGRPQRDLVPPESNA